MPIRHSRQTQASGSVPGGSQARRPAGERRRAWATLGAVLLALVLVAAALLAPATQARRPKAELPNEVEGKWADGVAMITCTHVHWTFTNLPVTPQGTVTVVEVLRVDGSRHRTTFSIDGQNGSQTTAIDALPGPSAISAVARWRVGKLGGHLSIHAKLTCAPDPALSVLALQEIAGGGSYTTSPLSGLAGQTVDYEMLVQNTGNVPLTLGGFTDAHCDAGTLSGGPGGAALAPEASTSYTCTHLLDAADQAAGSYSNTAAVTGTPPPGEGSPVTHGSNTLVVDVAPASAPRQEPHQETDAGGTTGTGSSTPDASSGELSGPPSAANAGVLGFAAVSVPALNGPQGCVRGRFHVSIKSAGVQSVTFYLDGRKLRTLTAKNAHKRLLTIEIDPTGLKVGAHRLLAKITMAHSASVKATVASRKVTILRCEAPAVKPKLAG
jgi:hypothetical protein